MNTPQRVPPTPSKEKEEDNYQQFPEKSSSMKRKLLRPLNIIVDDPSEIIDSKKNQSSIQSPSNVANSSLSHKKAKKTDKKDPSPLSLDKENVPPDYQDSRGSSSSFDDTFPVDSALFDDGEKEKSPKSKSKFETIDALTNKVIAEFGTVDVQYLEVPTTQQLKDELERSEVLSSEEKKFLKEDPWVVEIFYAFSATEISAIYNRRSRHFQTRYAASTCTEQSEERVHFLFRVYLAIQIVEAYHGSSFRDYLLEFEDFMTRYTEDSVISEIFSNVDHTKGNKNKQRQMIQFCNLVRVCLFFIPKKRNKGLINCIAIFLERLGTLYNRSASPGRYRGIMYSFVDSEYKKFCDAGYFGESSPDDNK